MAFFSRWTKNGITSQEATLPRVPPWQRLLVYIFGTGFGTGFLPVAQGTAGSLLLVILYWWLVPSDPFIQITLLVFITAWSIVLSGWGEKMWGEDPGRITIDEFAGQALALLLVPKTLPLYLAAFLLFRIFDTFKLPFIRRLEKLHGGLGVTLDDTAAGIIARIILIPLMLFLG